MEKSRDVYTSSQSQIHIILQHEDSSHLGYDDVLKGNYYQSSWHHIPEHLSPHQHNSQNLKSCNQHHGFTIIVESRLTIFNQYHMTDGRIFWVTVKLLELQQRLIKGLPLMWYMQGVLNDLTFQVSNKIQTANSCA